MHTILFITLLARLVDADPASTPRWGSASVVLQNTLFIYGGRTDSNQAQTYNGLVSSDILTLDLSDSFDLSSPPWNTPSNNQSPPLAFHTLTSISPNSALLFGGDGGPSLPLPTRNDSAGLFSASGTSSLTVQPPNWQNEPVRSEFHASASVNGRAYIFGGMEIDGSKILSDSWIYDPSSGFSALPTTSAPPALYGHAAMPVSSGSIVLFGGFTGGGANPLSTVYLLNTTNSPPTWSVTSATGNPIPTARRNFATAALGQDRIFIHGGTTDSGTSPQNFLDDGWVLDTKANPMVWTAVPNAAALGDRSDHVAVGIGGQILFAFGWQSSGPANTSLSLYDTTSNSFVPHFSAPLPTATAAGTSNPFTSATSGLPSESITVPSSTSTNPSSSPTGAPTNNNVNQHSLAIALATVFGVLAIVGLIGGATYVTIKRREERGGAFYRMEKDEPIDGDDIAGGGGAEALDPSPHNATAPETVRMLGLPNNRPQSRVGGALSVLSGALLGGIGARWAESRNGRHRTDMFAEEDEDRDVESFHAAVGGRPKARRETSGWSHGSSISNWYGAGSRKRWGWDTINRSFLRSRKDLSTSDQAAMTEKEIPWWDANAVPLDPFGDDMALRAREEESSHAQATSNTEAMDDLASNNVSGLAAVGVGLPAERPRGGMRLVDPWSTDSMELGYSFPYMDPTTSTAAGTSSDQHVRSDLFHVSAPGESAEQPVIPLETTRSRASTTSGRALDGSLSSHSGASFNLAGSSSSAVQSAGLVLGTTSILGGLQAPAQNAPVRRSDSWWSRFSRGSGSGSRPPRSPVPGGTSSGNVGEMEFRDPQPAPKLVPIKEGSGASAEGSVDRQGSGGSRATHGSHSRAHSQRRPISVSSIGTGHTADSEAIERMGRMDVVQRGGTVSSVGTSESNADAVEDVSLYPIRDDDLSVVIEGDVASGSSRSVLRSDVVQSPIAVDNYSPDSPLIRPPPYPTAEGYSSGNSSSATSGALSGGSRVSDRVRAYEEREGAHPRETRRSTYGLAPRASLYIANPEPKTSDDS